MTSPDESGTRKTKYYPPSHDVLVHFAEQVGNELGEGFDDFEVVHGLADFLAVIAEVLAKDLNRKQHEAIDTGVE